MANSFEYASWLAMECLDLLQNKLGIANYFNTDYNKEFKKSFAVGDSVNVPYPAQFGLRQGLNYNPQDITRRHATITFNDPFGVDFEWDSAEEYLRVPKGRDKIQREILAPAMARLAQGIDDYCSLYAYQNAANVIGALGTNPTTYDGTSAAAKQLFDEYGCPEEGDRALIVPPSVMRAVKTANLALFNPVSDISKQFRRGIVSNSDGFDWYASNSLYRHTAGTAAALTTVSANVASGSSSFVMAGAAGLTVRKGDKLTFAAVRPVNPMHKRTFAPATTLKHFTVTADATIPVAGTVTVNVSPTIYGPTSPYQNVDALPLAGAVVTMWPGTAVPASATGVCGLALHRNAFALVGAELEEPKGSSVELVAQKRDPDSGIAVRFIRQFDGRSSKMINRFDVMLGFGTFYNDSCAAVIACA